MDMLIPLLNFFIFSFNLAFWDIKKTFKYFIPLMLFALMPVAHNDLYVVGYYSFILTLIAIIDYRTETYINLSLLAIIEFIVFYCTSNIILYWIFAFSIKILTKHVNKITKIEFEKIVSRNILITVLSVPLFIILFSNKYGGVLYEIFVHYGK